jgi:hypothetical protein
MKIHCRPSAPIALILLIAFAGFAYAAEQVQFGRKLVVGDKFTFSRSAMIDSSQSMSSNGQVLQQVAQKGTQTRSGTVVVEAVDEKGIATKSTYTFDKNCTDEVTIAGQQPQSQASALAGKTITVTRTGEKDLNYSPEVDAASAKELKEMFTPDDKLLPTKPVSVGDTWDIDPVELKQMVPPGAQVDAKAQGKLISVETVAGRQVANVEVTMSLNATANGMTIKSEMQGKGKIDVQSGQPIEVEFSGPTKGSGRQQTPQGAIDVAIESKIGLSMKMKREASGGGGGAAVNPVPGPGPGPGPVAPNPLGQGGGSDFAGTFSNEKLTVKLISGFAGWTGTFKTGDKEYPISAATTNGSKITGKFTVDGNAFEFEGTLDGKTLTISTGGATHTLTRAAAANPLGK